MSDSENFIIEKVLTGDKDSFSEIIDKYKSYIFAIILSITRDKYEAENIAQDTFLQIYRSLPTYKSDNFKGWIGRIATNKAIDYKRKKQKIVALETEFKEEIHSQEIDEKSNIEYSLIQREELNGLHHHFNELPSIYSVILTKYYFEEKNYKTIANEESISIKTVESRLYRAKKILNEKLREG